MPTGEFQVTGANRNAPFSLKLHRGDGMTLVAMDWKDGQPPDDFVGFAIEYKEPGGDRYYSLKNRLGFLAANGKVNPAALSTRLSPIQKFRWVHFPRFADLPGEFLYRVTPVYMNPFDELSYGEAQEAAIELRRYTYPNQLNVTFTRGFVSSQAFVDRYAPDGDLSTLLPAEADEGLRFKPTHPQARAALYWMGFEARQAILEVLDQAIADPLAQVRLVAYDLSEPEIVNRLAQLGARLKAIIDDSSPHGETYSAETQAEALLKGTAGAGNVKRQHMAKLQHNKLIIVDSPQNKTVICGSTNFSWRGLYVQSNNALVLHGALAVDPFWRAFEHYWSLTPTKFRQSLSTVWTDLGLAGIDARVSFSPHGDSNALLAEIANDIASNTHSSLFFSLAFLYQTPGLVLDAINQVTRNEQIFVYGISDRKVGGLNLQKPDGSVLTVYPAQLKKNIPAPFKQEPSGGSGIRMHHKFIVVDFNLPSARVYLGSYNFSVPADTQNGENLLLIRDQRVAVSYMIEALRMVDHYHFRTSQALAKKAHKVLSLSRPPRKTGEVAWWLEDFTVARKILDRNLFA